MNNSLDTSKWPRFSENKIKHRRTRLYSMIKKPDACFYYRILNPFQQLARQFGWEVKYKPIDPLPNEVSVGIPPITNLKGLLAAHLQDIEWADIVVMQRPTCEHHLELMRYVKKELKKPILYESDDNYIDVPKTNTGYNYFTPRAQFIKGLISEADGLTVTTESCGDIYRPLRIGKPIFICPNSINFQDLDSMPTKMLEYEIQDKRKYFIPMKQMRLGLDQTEKYKTEILSSLSSQLQKQNIQFTDQLLNSFYEKKQDVKFFISEEVYSQETDGKKMMFWSGSPTHMADLATVTEPIKNLMRDNQDWIITMGGFIHHDWFKLIDRNRIYLLGLVPVKYYYSFLKQAGATVSFAAVEANEFNKAKSSIKVNEAQAIGVYSIATDFVTYDREHVGPHVPLCKTTEDWEKAMREAMNDDAMRFEVVQKNREWVEKNCNLEINVKYWKEAYEHFL